MGVREFETVMFRRRARSALVDEREDASREEQRRTNVESERREDLRTTPTSKVKSTVEPGDEWGSVNGQEGKKRWVVRTTRLEGERTHALMSPRERSKCQVESDEEENV